MKLSIIVLSWNTAPITLKGIRSLKKYLPQKDVEIIVVDNHSQDDTVSRLQKENINVITNSDNFGFAKGNNIGTRKAVGEYLLFLNSDIELIDNSLLSMLDYLMAHSQVGAIGPRMLNLDLTPQASVFPPQTASNAFREFWLRQPAYSKHLPAASQPISVFAISGGALMISHKLFNLIGGWDEKYFFYFEDLDLCRRIHRQNLQVIYYPQSQVIHFHGASIQQVSVPDNAWRRLIPGSITYHGLLGHYIINSIIWSSQKFYRIFSR